MEEEALIYAKTILDTDTNDWWDELSDKEKAGIEEGLAQSERGQGMPHEEVMKKFDKWK